MKKENVIEVHGLYKKFTRNLKRSLLYGSVDIAKSMVGINPDSSRLRKSEFWSLEDLSFELKQGEALGIIGENGSGKTTLLRLINGIFPPDRGTISVRGSIGALIAIGAGFHPHMTGRENIYLNGTILGMSKDEIVKKMDDILEFADIGEFIDAPVATYSSGMNVRLGFAIAIHSTPEILLADEALAVGDLSFALKCYRKIAEYRKQGGSIILVSHGMSLIRNTCNQVLWLQHGKTKAYGDVQSICDNYEMYMMQKDANVNTETGTIINNDPLTTIPLVEFLDKNGKEISEHNVNEPLKIRIHFDCKRKVEKPIFSVALLNPENITVMCNFTNLDGFKIDSIEGQGYVDFTLEQALLKPAEYRCTITFAENNDINNILEWHDKSHPFLTSPNGFVTYGLVNAFPRWDLKLQKD